MKEDKNQILRGVKITNVSTTNTEQKATGDNKDINLVNLMTDLKIDAREIAAMKHQDK